MQGKARLIQLNNYSDERGTVSVLELTSKNNNAVLPFSPKRIYFLFGHELDVSRGAHAHKSLRQVIFAVSGEVKIEIDNGRQQETFYLSSPREALVLEPTLWRDLELSPGAVVAVLASEVYDENDYIRNYNDFVKAMGKVES